MEENKLLRISELSKKSSTTGLSEAEKKEQAELRREYLDAVRKNLKATLDNIEFKK